MVHGPCLRRLAPRDGDPVQHDQRSDRNRERRRRAAGATRQCVAWWISGVLAAVGIAVVFVTTRRHSDVPVVPATGNGAMLSGLVGLAFAPPGAIMTGHAAAIILMGLVVMPLSWGLLTLAPRHSSPTNVSLFMLLEMVLAPFWVWLGTGERPTLPLVGGGALVVLTLIFYFLAAMRKASAEAAPSSSGDAR